MANTYEDYFGKLVYRDGSKMRSTLEKYFGISREETGVLGVIFKHEMLGYCFRITNTCRYEDGVVVEKSEDFFYESGTFILSDNEIGEFVIIDDYYNNED